MKKFDLFYPHLPPCRLSRAEIENAKNGKNDYEIVRARIVTDGFKAEIKTLPHLT